MAQASNAKFIDAALLNPQTILSTSAAPGLSSSAKELAELHQIQSTRSPAQILKAQRDQARKSIFRCQDVVDEKFIPKFS